MQKRFVCAKFRAMISRTNEELTTGAIVPTIIRFFIPLLLGTFFQQLYNTIDTIVVGRYVGKEALAACGGGTAVYVNLLVGFFTGLSAGSSVIISHFFGAKDKKALRDAVDTSVWIALVMGSIMMTAGFATSSFALSIIATPPDIFEGSLSYLKIYFLGTIPSFMYNMSSGILRATGDSRSPFIILGVGVLINVVLDLFFVCVLGMGVAGAAWATVLCQIISAILIIARMRKDTNFYFRLTKMRFHLHIMQRMMALGLPSGVQSSLYTVSNLLIQSNVNFFGTASVAAWAAYGRIDGFFWMTSASYGQALTVFAGQNLGAGKMERIKRANTSSLIFMSLLALAYTVLFLGLGKEFYSLFTREEDVLHEGLRILRVMAPFLILYIPIEIYSGTVHGAGDAFYPMIITLAGVCLLRVFWLIFALPFHRTLEMVLYCYPITWGATSVAYFFYYHSKVWLKHARIKGNE